jgi:three-Cys-motif partner protein
MLADELLYDITWKADAHTLAKHEILKLYLQAWFPILGFSEKKLIYLDGFAGPGLYKDGEKGSPIIALGALLEHKHKNKLLEKRTQFLFVFIEKDKERAEVLKKIIKKLFPDLPENINYQIFQAEFAQVLEKALTYIENEGAELAPTFAFLDPFGYAGLPLRIVCRILRYDKCEVLITFMTSMMTFPS